MSIMCPGVFPITVKKRTKAAVNSTTISDVARAARDWIRCNANIAQSIMNNEAEITDVINPMQK